jgi:hypothetical protein
MWLFYTLSVPVGLIILMIFYGLIDSLKKIVIVKMAIKGVPPEDRAEVIRATGCLFKHEGPLALIGIRRKELPGKGPMDSDE